MKKIEMIDGKMTLKLDVDVFIIPNGFGLVHEFFIVDKKLEFASKVCELNDLERFNPDKDLLTELWFVSTDSEAPSENIVNHGIRGIVNDAGEEVWIRASEMSNLPAKIFEGHSEGDVIRIKAPVKAKIMNTDGEPEELILDMNVRLNQTEYRYARSGRFEDLFERSKSAATVRKAANSCEAAYMEN